MIDGVWRFSDGTGKFAGGIGQGTYKTRMTSPTELECTWQGRYELAVATRAAYPRTQTTKKARSPRLLQNTGLGGKQMRRCPRGSEGIFHGFHSGVGVRGRCFR